jgi:hypothetical protein
MPTLECDTIIATWMKCGYPQYPGYISSPPKMFLTKEWTGKLQEFVWNLDNCGIDPPGAPTDDAPYAIFSGSCTFNRTTCTASGGLLITEAGGTTPVLCADFLTGYIACASLECPPVVTDFGGLQQEVFTPDEVCYSTFPAHKFVGTATTGVPVPTELLYNEYTTGLLITDTEGMLPSYPNTWDGDSQAIRDLSPDEMSYNIQRFKYRFQLPSLGGYSFYRIDWLEDGAPMSYTLDGFSSVTPEYGPVLEPSTNGTKVISGISVTCF